MRIVYFGGLEPKLEDTKLSYQQATIAENCELYSRSLSATNQHKKGPKLLTKNGTVFNHPTCATIAKVGGNYVGFETPTFYARDLKGCDCGESVLFVEDGQLKRLSSGSLSKKTAPSLVGVCGPLAAPLVNKNTSGAVAPLSRTTNTCEVKIPPHAAAFYLTYVNDCGEESSPSLATGLIDFNIGEGVTLTDPNPAPPANVSRRWYAYIASEGATTDYFIGETTGSTVSSDMDVMGFSNKLHDTSQFVNPPACLEGVCSFGNAVAVWSGAYFWLSEPYQPHAYKQENLFKLDAPIIAIHELNGRNGSETLIAFTTEGIYRITGNTISQTNVVFLGFNQIPINKQGIIKGEGCLYFPSSSGICRVSVEGVDLVSDAVLTEREWARYVHEDMFLGYGNHQLTTSTGLVIVAQTASKARATFTTTTHTDKMFASFTNADNSMLFYDGEILQWWRADSRVRSYRWRSKSQVMNGRMIFTSLKVVGDFGRGQFVTVKVWGDGTIINESRFTKSGIARVDRTGATEFLIEVEGNAPVREVHLQTSDFELVQEGGAA